MGPKRVGLAKESSGIIETQKKKIPVSVGSTKILSDKNKENSSNAKRRAMSSSINIVPQQNLSRSQNSHVSSSNPPKKSNQSVSSAQFKSTSRNPSRTVDAGNANKKPVTESVSKVTTVNSQKEKNQNVVSKEGSGTVGKTFGKSKAGHRPSETRSSITSSLHPVAFIKDESKIFKEKSKNNKIEKSQTASSKSSSSTINIEICKDISSTNCSRKSSISGDNSVENCAVPLTKGGFGHTSLNQLLNENVSHENTNLDSNEFNSEVNDKKADENHCYLDNNASEVKVDNEDEVINCKLNNKSEVIGDQELLPPVTVDELTKTECVGYGFNDMNKLVSENDNLGIEMKESSSLHMISENTSMNVTYTPSFFVESVKSEIFVNEFGEQKGFEVKSQSYDRSLETEPLDEMLESKMSCTTINLEVPNIALREMKHTQSSTTMNSFDGKTFIFEEQLVIPKLMENFRQIESENSKQLEIEMKTTLSELEETASQSASVKSVVQVDESNKLNGNADISILEPDTPIIQVTSKKESAQNLCVEPNQEVNVNSEFNDKVENDFSEAGTNKSDHVFDLVDTLEVLNLDKKSTSELADTVIRNLLNAQEFSAANAHLFDDNDEFDTESVGILHSMDMSNCVWMDYKIQLNKPKLDDDENWVLDDDDSIEHNATPADLVLLDADEQDWLITERSLHELRARIDECEQEANAASRELNLLTMTNKGATKAKMSYPGNIHKQFSKRGSKIKETSIDDIKIVNVSESVPNQDVSTPNFSNYIAKPGLTEDDIDYFSVSSGDEGNEFEENKLSEVKPQKSYLSFGKSCVKMKKKNEKRIFLSFFNLFK